MKKVLAVDDDSFILELVGTALKDSYKIVNASNVKEAKQILDNESFDILITDILMPPGEDGTKLMRYSKEKHPDLPILAMTAGLENAVEDYVNYASLFSDQTLAKPFSKEDIVRAVAELLSQ
jgi:DNA-binding NtrC family response regulator